ncbi:putative 3-oxoacyl-[acyl-carrier-protein] reductase [Marvinbryantia formatexigens DSM 14469]|uniref:3-oxoacyl-[acyl-carrier-protein] reductase n=1 Tax=Marvinbryantia formatexigens DSM 14469 TaxID=478749 RepID=C6LFM6_9FIRM|nr:SDR family NAD(P)-dependent oxidoreductase [Marvinbryantia formatexigens]EET60611.1 putative 3-oxoacyl-[acyl-carrier-protein] reductase [Marvinbryantia formatexigens DSM 14469]UWO25599.1 SDR family NAD(P)-dependent oxidoreductase [Marvinbryantia formatexigens DSM 14469]SDG18118.1 3-oxoacyl-[acyl-carrier protein] reductase [Marvinbryantia formatexigens]
MERKTACITGASRGIGRALAAAFAAQGYDLFLTCRKNEALLLSLKQELEQTCGIRCRTFAADAGSAAQMEHVFAEISNQTDHLHVLVNNAGISWHGLLTDMTPQEWDDLLRTNLSSVFYASRLAVPLMLHRHAGKILNISSVWGLAGASCEVAYSASKGGVNAFTKALAKELAPSNIQVNAIACGVIDTEMNGFLDTEERAALMDEIPAGRFASPEEVADLAVSLCGGHSYLTGQIITLDGGWI